MDDERDFDESDHEASLVALDEYDALVDIRADALNYALMTAVEKESPQDIVFRAQIYADWMSGVFTIENTYAAATPAVQADNIIDLRKH